MSKLFFTLACLATSFLFAEKIRYPLTSDPIDVVIPCVKKDLATLEKCIAGIKKNGVQVRRVIVISPEPLTEDAEWFDEEAFPFNKEAISLAIFNDVEKAFAYANSEWNKLGWLYQQLLKLYAPLIIPEISPNLLVLDADVIFLNPVEFIDAYGGPCFTPAGEHHSSYFEHLQCLIPGLGRQMDCSGIAHHMLFQRCVIEDLFKTVERIHGMPAWKAFCKCITDLRWASMSEYEVYFNFFLSRSDQGHVRPLKWKDVNSIKNLDSDRLQGYDFVAAHSWMRQDS